MEGHPAVAFLAMKHLVKWPDLHVIDCAGGCSLKAKAGAERASRHILHGAAFVSPTPLGKKTGFSAQRKMGIDAGFRFFEARYGMKTRVVLVENQKAVSELGGFFRGCEVPCGTGAGELGVA
ncbi:MAG: hypothetical protein OXC07_07585 [Kistimonas sp.]|nr:hypothetical protein [Kistimonas sp.]